MTTATVMDQESFVITDLVNDAYPGLTTLHNVHEWLGDRFVAPAAFILTQGASETQNSLTSYQVASYAVIVLHYPQSEGIYQPLSAEPLQQLLRQKQYSYRSNPSACQRGIVCVSRFPHGSSCSIEQWLVCGWFL